MDVHSGGIRRVLPVVMFLAPLPKIVSISQPDAISAMLLDAVSRLIRSIEHNVNRHRRA